MQSIDQFLEIEKNEKLYQFKVFDNMVHLWPMIRYQIIFTALYEKVEIPNPNDPFKIIYSHAFSYLKTTFKDRSSNAGQNDFIFFGNDVANIKTEQGYYNRLTEYYAKEYVERSILIEQSSNFSYKRPRTYKNVFVHDDILIKSKLIGLFFRLNKKDLNIIHYFVDFLKSTTLWDFKESFWFLIETTIIRLCKEYKIKYLYYGRLLDRIKPKIVFLDAASYGYANLALIVACKDKKIKLVECQHGLISLNHTAYNYHNNLPAIYLKYLPDYFLSYGKYWSENCRIPIPVINIGNPYLTQKISEADLSQKENQLLYASGGTKPEACVKNLLYLNKELLKKGYKIMFRPHPTEIHRLDTVYKPLNENGIEFDLGLLDNSLGKSKYVFSDYSTVIFESLAFKCIPIVLKTHGSDLFINCDQILILNSLDEIIELIGRNVVIPENLSYIWEENWKQNFRNFINKIID